MRDAVTLGWREVWVCVRAQSIKWVCVSVVVDKGGLEDWRLVSRFSVVCCRHS